MILRHFRNLAVPSVPCEPSIHSDRNEPERSFKDNVRLNTLMRVEGLRPETMRKSISPMDGKRLRCPTAQPGLLVMLGVVASDPEHGAQIFMWVLRKHTPLARAALGPWVRGAGHNFESPADR